MYGILQAQMPQSLSDPAAGSTPSEVDFHLGE